VLRTGFAAQAALVAAPSVEGGRDAFAGVLQAIRECGALDYARAAAQREADAAAAALKPLPARPASNLC